MAPVSSTQIVAAALCVLIVAGVLLFRELRGAVRAQKADVNGTSEAPHVVAPLVSADAGGLEDVTMVASWKEAKAKAQEALGLAAGPNRLALLSLSNEDSEDEGSSRSEAVTLFEDKAEVDEPTNPRELFFVAAVAQTDKGRRRRRNEDSYLILDEHALFVVADGMGGYAGGDIASQLAVDAVGAAFESDRFPVRVVDAMRPVHAMQLVSAVESAHNAVVEHAREHPDLKGMGTTIVGARFLKKKQRVYIAYVGDSRCYRLRNGVLKQLTTDHTLAARGVPSPMGNSIRRAVGIGKRIKVDLIVDVPQPDDVYLLCSDGLNKMISDDAICSTMVSAIRESDDIDSLARKLVEEANAAGGKDNVTALVARVLDAPPAAPS